MDQKVIQKALDRIPQTEDYLFYFILFVKDMKAIKPVYPVWVCALSSYTIADNLYIMLCVHLQIIHIIVPVII